MRIAVNDGDVLVIVVSIHAPVWGAKDADLIAMIYREVSIHAPVWGAKLTNSIVDSSVIVSIHAPVWGANLIENAWGQTAGFQSTHPCGVRTPRPLSYQRLSSFNPRTRVGCEADDVTKRLISAVSIHAPVWGANKCEGDKFYGYMFQSTHPCGVRTF